jgi:hypothetical protein
MTEQLTDQDLSQQWQEQGYIIVRRLLAGARATRLGVIVEPILDQWRIANPETGEPGGGPDATVMRHLNHPWYFRSTQRA